MIVETSWGKFDVSTARGKLMMAAEQLRWGKDNGIFHRSEYLNRDIEGYQVVLDSQSEHNAARFIELKRDLSRAGKWPGEYGSNLGLVSDMKAKGIWEVRSETR